MGFSVIIPLYNSDYIQVQLKSIQRFLPSLQSCEFIYVDDGSDTSFLENYQTIFDSQPSDSIYFFSLGEEKLGKNRVGQARNFGARRAKYETLIFIDQDTLISKHYFTSLLKSIDRSQEIILGSYYGYNNNVKKLDSHLINEYLASGKIENKDFLDFRVGNPDMNDPKKIWQYFCGSNFIIQKDIFLSLGGFDETITTWGDEDVELGYRLYKASYNIVFESEQSVLNLSKKLYQKPFHILEQEKVFSLSKNWIRHIQKHTSLEYEDYVKNRYNSLPNNYKPFVSPQLLLYI